jgi:exodeoxyribonuclease III
LHPDETIYAFFWDYFRNAFQRNAGLRIDHFLLSLPLMPRLRAGAVDIAMRGWGKVQRSRAGADRTELTQKHAGVP